MQHNTANNEQNAVYAYIDGSYNQNTKTYGFGIVLYANGEKRLYSGFGNDESMLSMRNVAGELLGAVTAIKIAKELKLPEITLFYDYQGIEAWANNTWKANKVGTIAYKDFIKESRKEMKITFQKVKAHSGIEGNEEADKLAKQAVGL